MFQEEQGSIIIITIVLAIGFWYVGNKVKQLNRDETPNRIVAAAISYVQFISNYTTEAMGERYGKKFAAYIGSIFFYLLVANMSGLLGFSTPTANYSVPLVFAFITWISIQVVSIRENGIKGYLSGFLDPFPFFIIPNIFGQIAPLISLSLRMFGNVTSGAVIMSLLYTFTGWLSQFIPVIGGFNFIGVVIAPVLHLYFDLFSGFLQAFIFVSLSIIFIGIEIPREKL